MALAGRLDLIGEDGADFLALVCEEHPSDEAANAGVPSLSDGLELAEKAARLVYWAFMVSCGPPHVEPLQLIDMTTQVPSTVVHDPPGLQVSRSPGHPTYIYC